jgi:phosphoribosylaminoimidazole-succinocarboxamide synthase
MQKRAELYRGKAKTVYSTDNPDLLAIGGTQSITSPRAIMPKTK